ncbi:MULTISPECIES: GNAT family N-acetyltransferase [unclassified Streptomyces]|uniref:GNAT family N-acetyltransferase n=1 Tax=unclassified Streptomyces TaxID=2593676 RepID=UPI003332885E
MGSLSLRLVRSAADRNAVLRLRDSVYVHDQGRLADAADTAETFDRFDDRAEYILGCLDAEPVGTIKVVPDSAAGLPCDDVVDLAGIRPGHRLVEFGHLMTLPEVRHHRIGMALMREALVHSVREHRVTRVLGDFFADDSGGLRSFYTQLGFVPVGRPYPDTRFQGAPLSVVGMLDIDHAVRLARTPEGRAVQGLQYFFGDYDTHAGGLPAPAAGR